MKRVSRRGRPPIAAVIDRSARLSAVPQPCALAPLSIYALAVASPAVDDALRAAPELALLPDMSLFPGLSLAAVQAGADGVNRYCDRIRSRTHRILFLPRVPGRPHHILHRLPASAAPIPFCASLSDWQVLACYGRPLLAESFPPLTAFNGLSDPGLLRQFADVMEKLVDSRILELAVYQKVTDIVARGWL